MNVNNIVVDFCGSLSSIFRTFSGLFNQASSPDSPLRAVMMPAPKRTASDSFSSSQQLVVKRQKSDANLTKGSTIAVVGNNAQSGALVQSV